MSDIPTPDQIHASIDVLKAISALNPILGITVVIVTGIGAAYNWISNKITKKNTAVTIANNEAMATRKKDEEDFKQEIKDIVSDFETTVKKTTEELTQELNKVKIVEVKIQTAAEQKLSLLPKIQDAITRQQKQIEENKSKTDEILNVLTRGKL